MENLRWILIFAGVAILVLLYLSGRQPKSNRRQGDVLNRANKRANNSNTAVDPLLGDDSFADPLEDFDVANDFDLERPAGQSLNDGYQESTAGVKSAVSGGFGGISSKIDSLSSKFSGRRKRSGNADGDDGNQPSSVATESKIVTLHVVAPEGQLMNGAHLLDQFEQRNYHYGDMNIFHSMHEGKTVFSIAKMVMPGTFDINDVDSFQTPGISLILQLPGPVPADVAFEVLLSEAHEIADMLGATVLDADRSSLSKQTIQHMREGISDYMHKQKYFNGVPS